MDMVSATRRIRRGAPSLTVRVLIAVLLSISALSISFGVAHGQTAESTSTVLVAKTHGEGRESEAPFVGAQFQLLELLGLNASSEEDLQKLIAENPRLVYGDPGVAVGTRLLAETDQDGIARFPGVSPGIYQLRELPSQYGDVERNAATTTLVRVEAGRTVSIRAKNQPMRVDKEVNTSFAQPGATVGYRVTSNVPDVDADGKLYRWEFKDQLDDSFASGKITRIVIANADSDKDLKPGVHYKDSSASLTLDAALEEPGLQELARLRDGHPETTVAVHIEAVLREDVPARTRVPNIAQVAVDGERLSRNAEQSPRVTFTVLAANEPAPSTSAWPEPTDPTRPGQEMPGQNGGQSDTSAVPPQQQKTPEPPGRGPAQVLDKLATTGASVLGIVLAGLCAIAIAIVLLRRKREETNETGE
ncbi:MULTISPECIES: isopeptide-forming domain-containing fimbrial protein [unclassified Corynebacterium]